MAKVPSLEGSTYITDPQSIIVYTLKRYFNTPKNAIPLFGNAIISLPGLAAEYWQDPDTMSFNMKGDLTTCLQRIFQSERQITVDVPYTKAENGDVRYSINISFTRADGDAVTMTARCSVNPDGKLVIPEDRLGF